MRKFRLLPQKDCATLRFPSKNERGKLLKLKIPFATASNISNMLVLLLVLLQQLLLLYTRDCRRTQPHATNYLLPAAMISCRYGN